MRLKDNSIHPGSTANGFALMLLAFKEAYDTQGVPFVITSINDGRHGDNSFHYYDAALDARIRDPRTGALYCDPHALVEDIRSRLNEHFDVIYEDNPPHIHGEYDPKRAPGR